MLIFTKIYIYRTKSPIREVQHHGNKVNLIFRQSYILKL